MNRSKKITILILAILTGVLATVAVIVSLNLRGTTDVPVSVCGEGEDCNPPSPSPTDPNICGSAPECLAGGAGTSPFCEPGQTGFQCRCVGVASDTCPQGRFVLNCTQQADQCLPPQPTGGGTGGVVSPGSNAFSCNLSRVCTLSNGDFTFGNNPPATLNCNTQTGYVFFCPNGFDASGRCLQGEQSIGTFQGGQTVDINPFLNRGCGAYQVDFQPPGYPASSGACGAVKYTLSGDNCTPTSVGADAAGGGSGPGGGTTVTPPVTNSLSVTGRVVCQDPGQAAIPMEGVRIRAETELDGDVLSFAVNTNANGTYTLPVSLEDIRNRRYTIYVLRLPEGGQLPNGRTYSSLTGALATNCDSSLISCTNSTNPSGNYCNVTNSSDSDRYNSCRLNASTSNPTYNNFNFTYTNCGVSVAPRCGDSVCQPGEFCESTTPNGSTFKTCGTTPGSAISCRGLGGNTQTPACTFCGDGVVQTGAGEQCDPNAPGTAGQNCSPTCQTVTAACVSLERTAGPNPLRNGAGNTQEYTAVYRNTSSTNPFPNIRLRVNNAASPVGRDFNSQQNVLVSPISSTFDVTQSTWTYKFVWEAAMVSSNANVPTPPNSYPVRILPNGTAEETAAACLANVELNDTAAQEPQFSIVKEATTICQADRSFDISYRIRVQNIGPVSGVIDYVEDTIDSRLVTANILPTGITPNFGIYTAGRIRWEGTTAQRTFASGEIKEYSFSVRIPSNLVSSFNGTTILNDVVAIFDTPTQQNNTISFTLRTPVSCSTIVTPSTGLFDGGSAYILIAFLFIFTALVMYRYKFGSEFTQNFAEKLFYKSPLATFEQKIYKDAGDKLGKKG